MLGRFVSVHSGKQQKQETSFYILLVNTPKKANVAGAYLGTIITFYNTIRSLLYVFVVPENFIGKAFFLEGFWGARMWF